MNYEYLTEDEEMNIDLLMRMAHFAESDIEVDMVNAPAHYTSGDIECIDAMEAASGMEEFTGYLRLTAFKYIWRLGKKWDDVEDAKKAIWYLNKYVEFKE